MKKKGAAAVIALLLSVMMVLSVVPVSALAAQTDDKVRTEDKTEQENTYSEDAETYEESIPKEDTEENQTVEQEITAPEKDGTVPDVKEGTDNAYTEKKEEAEKGKKQIKSEGEFPDEVSDNNIPVLTLTVPEDEWTKVLQSEDHSYRSQEGTVKITVPDGYTGDYSDTPISGTEELDLEFIRGRGNSTWRGEGHKNPFKFKLEDSKNLLNMGKNKHWVLLANSYDPSLLRNRIVAYMGDKIGLEFTPKFTPVDLVVNGQYLGSYVLGHEIRVGNNRVDIDELTPEDNAEPDITGGYLLALHPYYKDNPEGVFETRREMDFMIESPEFGEGEDGTAEQKQYIKNYMQRVEDAIYSEDFRDKSGTPIEDLIDFESFARYWLIQEYTVNGDGFVTPSTYFYKKRDSGGKIGKLYAGPLWDFDLTFSFEGTNDSMNYTQMQWIDELRDRNPEFVREINEAWEDLDPIITDITKKGGVLDRYSDEIRNSWEDNYQLYSVDDEIETGFSESVETLRKFMLTRQAFLNESIDELAGKVYCTFTFIADDEEVYSDRVRFACVADVSDYLNLKSADREGYVLVDWKDSEGVSMQDYDVIMEDVTFYAEYIPQGEAVLPEAIFFRQYDVWVDINEEQFDYWYYTIVPEYVQSSGIWWSSSDTSVASCNNSDDSRHEITLESVGEAVLTARTKSGAYAKMTLHVFDPQQTPWNEDPEMILESDHLELDPGEYGQVKVSFSPQPAEHSFDFMSDDIDIAKVDVNGVVQGVAPGETKIIVMNELNGDMKEYTVTVKDNSEEMKKAVEELSDKIVEASGLISSGRYTKESVEKLRNVIAEANEKLDDPYLTMRDVNILRTKLIRAMRLLEPVDLNEEEEKKEYSRAVDALATTLIDAYKVDASKYRANSFKEFSAALKKGSALLEKEDATVDELRNARSDILKKWQKLQKKKANTLKAKGKKIKVKKKTLKKKSITVKKNKVFTVKKGVGKVSYRKLKGNSKINVSSNGNVIISKGLKKGTYSITAEVRAAGNGDYKKGVKKVKVKIKVK